MRSRHYLISAGLATALLNPGLKNSTYKAKSPISALFPLFFHSMLYHLKYIYAHNSTPKNVSASELHIR